MENVPLLITVNFFFFLKNTVLKSDRFESFCSLLLPCSFVSVY